MSARYNLRSRNPVTKNKDEYDFSDGFVIKDEEYENLKSKITEKLKDAFEDVLDDEEYSTNGYLEGEYLEGDWKDDVEFENEDEEIWLEEELQSIIEEMKEDIPNVKKILKSNIPSKYKKDCIYYLDLVKNTDSHDPVFIEVRDKLISLYKKKTPDVDYQNQIEHLEASDTVKENLYKMLSDIETSDVEDSDTQSKKLKLTRFLELPYNKTTDPLYKKLSHSEFLLRASKLLDEKIYGMDNIKQILISVMSDSIVASKYKGCVIGLNGPPGVGKTIISKVFAECLGLPFQQITVGGSKDASVLIGSDNVWSGSSPGQIAQSLINMKCSNGVLLIDEIDKVSEHGLEIFNKLNHILDFETNMHCEDSYFREIPLDLSKIWFVVSMNDVSLLPSYLKDRITIVNVNPYTSSDKMVICKDFMLPKFISSNDISFTDEAIRTIVNISKEKGVRDMQNIIRHIGRKLNLHVIMKDNVANFKYCDIKDFKLPFVVTPHTVQILIKDLNQKPQLSYYN